MIKHKLEQSIIESENLMTKIPNNSKTQEINEGNLFKTLLILFTVIIVIIYGLAVKVSWQYQGQRINQQQFLQLKHIFQSKYNCNSVYFVNNYKLSDDQMLLQDLRGCVSYEHYYEENITEFSNALHKCAVIRSQDMISDYIRYQKIQFLAFETPNNSLIINQIQEKIAHYKLENLRSIFWQNVHEKLYAIIQFKKPFQVSDRGYYIGNEEQQIKEQFNYSQIFNKQLIEFYQKEKAENILDLGCGLCNYTINIKNAGFDAVGYDGNPYTPELTEGFGKVLDLTRRYDLEKKFDWVQSFQVGQHIPPSKTNIYVQNMVRHARKGIIVSWATLGQKGLSHINTKNNEEVIKIFQSYNFTVDRHSTAQLRQKSNLLWVKTNLLIFRRR